MLSTIAVRATSRDWAGRHRSNNVVILSCRDLLGYWTALDLHFLSRGALCLALDYQLPVEVPVFHGLVGAGHVVQGEYPGYDSAQGAVVDHLHEIGEGPVAAATAAHELQRPPVEQR